MQTTREQDIFDWAVGIINTHWPEITRIFDDVVLENRPVPYAVATIQHSQDGYVGNQLARCQYTLMLVYVFDPRETGGVSVGEFKRSKALLMTKALVDGPTLMIGAESVGYLPSCRSEYGVAPKELLEAGHDAFAVVYKVMVNEPVYVP